MGGKARLRAPFLSTLDRTHRPDEPGTMEQKEQPEMPLEAWALGARPPTVAHLTVNFHPALRTQTQWVLLITELCALDNWGTRTEHLNGGRGEHMSAPPGSHPQAPAACDLGEL